MVHSQRLHQVDSAEVSLGLILLVANELSNRRGCRAHCPLLEEVPHLLQEKTSVQGHCDHFEIISKNKMQVKQSEYYII